MRDTLGKEDMVEDSVLASAVMEMAPALWRCGFLLFRCILPSLWIGSWSVGGVRGGCYGGMLNGQPRDVMARVGDEYIATSLVSPPWILLLSFDPWLKVSQNLS